MRWLGNIIDSMDMSVSTLWEMVKTGKPGSVLQHGGHKEVDMPERLNKNKKGPWP